MRGAGEVSGALAGQQDDPCGDGTVVCLDCISVDILMVVLHSSFVRCYHYSKLGKETAGSLLQLHVNL